MGDDRKQKRDDVGFADRVMGALPSVPVPAALEARILADFDAVAARLAPGLLSRLMRRWRDTIWPGAPVWKPASVLALSLIVGLMAGALVPSTAVSQSDQSTTSSFDTSGALEMSGDF